MKRFIPRKYIFPLLIILIIGIIIRFINFRESVYFGYDEARDAYLSQEIYLEGDIKLLGPQATAFAGIHHGPFYYYLIGPLFILGKGNPYFVSIFFRLINALGIIGMFVLGSLLFTPITGLISSFIYAVSYEQFIYAIFTGNPSISNVSWILMFIGAGLVNRYKDRRIFGLFLIFLGATIIPQFDMVGGYSIFVLVGILLLLKDKLKGITIKQWIAVFVVGLSPIYTYLIAEIKNNFIASKTIIQLVTSEVSIVREGESEVSIFWNNFLGLFRDNILDFSTSNTIIALLFMGVVIYLLKKSAKNQIYLLVVLWMFSFSFLMLARGFMPFYSYAGVGVGLIVGVSVVFEKLSRKSKLLVFILVALITLSNVAKTIEQSSKSLIVEIKAQPGMKLSDEIQIVRKTYEYSNNQAFTIRVTSMPYKVQTVWSYLYNQYGVGDHGYLPYFETGNVQGFPGWLPPPQHGTTCHRFLIREPIRGIPENLIANDEREENYFSEIVKEERIGKFLLQFRKSKGDDCHNIKPQMQ